MLETQPKAIVAQFEISDEQGHPFPLTNLPHRRVLAGEQEAQAIIGYRNKSSMQAKHWSISKARPVFDEHGKLLLVITILHDITERQELERRKDEFISIASHGLKTPITILKGFIQLLLRKFEQRGLPAAAPTLTKMEAQANRLTKLIDELLDVSKIQAGRVDYEEEPVDLAALLRETVELLQATSPTHTLHIRGTRQAWIMGDIDRLGQMLANLITNAIKYSPQATKVDLSLTASSTTVTFRVRDYGVGIPKAHQKSIFDRFYRVHNKHQAFSGLGLGLYITHEIVKRHGGEMTVESEEGKGSTFIVSLPLKKN
jgi:signal transduction histidine kinase